VAAFLTIVFLDWFLRLPAALRIVVTIFFVGGFVGAAWHWVVRPLRARVSIDDVAVRIEAHFEELGDQLRSSVHFLGGRDSASADMMREAVSRTERLIEQIPLEQALSARPFLVRCAWFVAGVTALLVIATMSPGWLQTGVTRYASPFGETEWQRRVLVTPLTGDENVALGESITVKMRVERGYQESLRALVRMKEIEDRPSKSRAQTMVRGENGEYLATIDGITTDLQYWFEVGDATTERRPATIRVVRRPEVVSASVTIEPPAYATRFSSRTHDPSEGPVRSTIGERVTLVVRTSKPIPAGQPADSVGLVTEEGEPLPLVVSETDGQVLSSSWETVADKTFRVVLRDADGFSSRGSPKYTILAVPDKPPSVTILEPRGTTELTPRALLPLRLRVEDDFGVERLELHARRDKETGDVRVTSLTDYLRSESTVDGATASAEHLWSLESIAPTPGEEIELTAAAMDNFARGDQGGQVGHSAPVRIKIISDLDFQHRRRDDLAAVEAQLRQILEEQTNLLHESSNMLSSDDSNIMLFSEEERGNVIAQGNRQFRLTRRTRELARRTQAMIEQWERNRQSVQPEASEWSELSSGLEQTATAPMHNAALALSRASFLTEANVQRETMRAAAEDQAKAADRLRSLVRRLSQGGMFQHLVTRVRDLLDRQNALHVRTMQLGRATLGRSVDALGPEESSELKRAYRQQVEIQAEADELAANMRNMLSSPDGKDPAGNEAVEEALRAARANDLSRRLQSAAESISENRMAAAALDQQAVEVALRKMVAALRRRDNRRLEQLAKQSRRAEEEVEQLIEQQEALLFATRESAEKRSTAGLETLAGDQGAIRRNTRLLARELVESEGTAPAAAPVSRAATSMSSAEERLLADNAQSSAESQLESVEQLKEALAVLRRLSEEAEEESLRRTLAQLREELESILSEQREINSGLEELSDSIQAAGKLGRSESRDASRLAGRQHVARGLVEALLPDLNRAAVYEFAMKRVVEWMKEVESKLDRRQVEPALTTVARRIEREIEKLIGAILETEKLPLRSDFVEAESEAGAGEGADQQAEIVTVPTVAELLVLKAMQADINERTRLLQHVTDDANASEEQLRLAAMLAEDQNEVRRLTELVTRRADQQK